MNTELLSIAILRNEWYTVAYLIEKLAEDFITFGNKESKQLFIILMSDLPLNALGIIHAQTEYVYVRQVCQELYQQLKVDAEVSAFENTSYPE